MEKRAQPLSTENRVQVINEYTNNVIKMDLAKELLEEEENKVMEHRTGLTEVTINIEGKNYKTLIDTGSEISVISENVMGELKELNKNIPSLPVAGVTVVGVTGVRSKIITKQVQLNILILFKINICLESDLSLIHI